MPTSPQILWEGPELFGSEKRDRGPERWRSGPAAVHIGGYARFVRHSLVVLVIAFAMPFEYTWVTIKRKENRTMAATKNLCAQVPIDLHQKISEAREQAGQTTSQYITALINIWDDAKLGVIFLCPI